MSNHDILYDLWLRSECELDSISVSKIGSFAEKNKNELRSPKGCITKYGINYAGRKFILEYTIPIDWPQNLWTEFRCATDNHNGNYGIWKKYLNLLVNVKSSKESPSSRSSQLPDRISEYVSTTSPDLDQYINWIVNKIDEIQTFNGKGWQGLIQSYEWPPGKRNLNEGIEYRRTFHFLVNQASEASGIGAKGYRQGLCTAIAGWGGINTIVDDRFAEDIFSTVRYLQSLGESDHIDLNKINGERIATSSKVYYFSNPLLWTIYDSRIAYALNILEENYAAAFPDIAKRLAESIRFSIPPNRKGRKNSELPWKDNNAALFFVRASFILRSITSKLNSNKKILPPTQGIFASGTWDMYHVEMALFMFGQFQGEG